MNGSVRQGRFETASVSSRGLVRSENQDHAFSDPACGLFAVADGMGGGEGGAKASEIVCSQLAASVRGLGAEMHPGELLVAQAVCAAHGEIAAYARRAGYRQMATTVAVLALPAKEDVPGGIGHIGDSRVYRFREGALEQLTVDHTWPGETAGERSHILTRAVGVGPVEVPDWQTVEVRVGDVYLVCSDGLHDMLSEAQIRMALSAGGGMAAVAARLEFAVCAAGAEDNYTFVLVEVVR